MQNLLIAQGVEITPQMRSSLPQNFTNPFSYIPDDLCRCAASHVISYLESKTQWHSELQQGKMFGVLVVETPGGRIGFLAAFSGNLQGSNNLEYFVPPVYDLLNPDEFFKIGEREISGINARIALLESAGERGALKNEIASVRRRFEAEIQELKRIYKEGKAERERVRGELASVVVPSNGGAHPGSGWQDVSHKVACPQDELLAQLTRQSQFQKAEIKRAEKGLKETLQPLEGQLKALEDEILGLRELRKVKSAALQEDIFRKFSFLNGNGERKDMLDIFSEFYKEQSLREGRAILPPGGAGECAAPKLLQYAFLHGMRPISMGEFWWGNSPRGEIRRHGEFYPSCKGKCAPILSHMLKGLPVETGLLHTTYGIDGELETLFSDDLLVAVNKPAGMASVPGKEVFGLVPVPRVATYPVSEYTGTWSSGIPELGDRVASHSVDNVANDFLAVHRLDMHTSGVLILARNESVYKELQKQFAGRSVKKCYMAVLDGEVSPERCGSSVIWDSAVSGSISLPLAADYDHRPAQKVDFEAGKEAVTLFEILGVKDGRTYVNFYPVTGRTHQLRVHSAHHLGLNTPIVGDLLYGKPAQRLLLHANWVEFQHPEMGTMKITSPLPAEFRL